MFNGFFVGSILVLLCVILLAEVTDSMTSRDDDDE